jgi:hypothetical protein
MDNYVVNHGGCFLVQFPGDLILYRVFNAKKLSLIKLSILIYRL